MTEIRGIYAASVSIFDDNLNLDINKTILYAENLINRKGCHGVAVFGSTGQAQLISISEKIRLISKLSESKLKDKFILGTGLNSLSETINLINISNKLGFKVFLVMPPAYYKYTDEDVIKYYGKIIEKIPKVKIILYNFEKLCGYKFSIECVEKLVKKFPKQIIGVKDSSYNLFEKLKIKNFSILPGSESKLLKGLNLGCSGIITATCNVTSVLARKVYEDFYANKEQTHNDKLCKVREVFEKFNLISALHTFLINNDKQLKNIIPPLHLLNKNDEKKLFDDLKKLDFTNDNFKL